MGTKLAPGPEKSSLSWTIGISISQVGNTALSQMLFTHKFGDIAGLGQMITQSGN